MPWEKLDPIDLQNLMHMSLASALEFAEAVRITLKLYPNNIDLQEMAKGELAADNLSFGSYKQKADHAEFLNYFIKAENVPAANEVLLSGNQYRAFCSNLTDITRAATIFSREEELSGIFERILMSPNWIGNGLPAFRYYLERHINLDSAPGGHHDLTKSIESSEDLRPFYSARLKMYQAIPKFDH